MKGEYIVAEEQVIKLNIEGNPVFKLEGQNGKSAYEIWLESGNSGTREDFLKSLKKGPVGPQGPQGIQGPKGEDGQSFTYDLFTEEQLIKLGRFDGNGANIATTYLKKAGDTVTGALNVPTQPTTDNSTKVANTAFVQSAVNNILNVMYPVGIIIEFADGADPNTKWVGTTWEQYESSNKWKRTA